MAQEGEMMTGDMNGGMNHETRLVDPLGFLGVVHDIAIVVDLDVVRGAHLVNPNTIVVDEEMVFGPGHPRADMGIYQIRHAEVGDQPIEPGQIAPDFPFGIGVGVTHRDIVHHTAISTEFDDNSAPGASAAPRSRTPIPSLSPAVILTAGGSATR